jgi:hypothetical protein
MDEQETAPTQPETTQSETPVAPPKPKPKQFGKPLWIVVIAILVIGAAAYVLMPQLAGVGSDETERAVTTFPGDIAKDFTLPAEAKPISALVSGSSVSATFSLPATHTPTEWVAKIATDSHFKNTKAHGATPNLFYMDEGRMRSVRYDSAKSNYQVRAEPYTMGTTGSRKKN